MGQPVPRKALQPGDLVFFKNTFERGMSHTGIYIGGGAFINAENESTGVTVSDLHSDYYRSRYYGAVRFTQGSSVPAHRTWLLSLGTRTGARARVEMGGSGSRTFGDEALPEATTRGEGYSTPLVTLRWTDRELATLAAD
jgi:NlpC/P60 family